MQRELPVRKHPRLKGYDYGSDGAYFITLCVKNGHEMLGQIVGRDVLIAPQQNDVLIAPQQNNVRLSEYGEVIDKHINKINLSNETVSVDKYVMMPNHIHIIFIIRHGRCLLRKTAR